MLSGINLQNKSEFYKSDDRPKFLEVIPENIPENLKRIPQWVLWVSVKREGRWTKVPLQIESAKPEYTRKKGLYFYQARSNDPSHGWDFRRVCNFYQSHCASGKVDGIGIFLRSGLCGIDWDDALKRDGSPKPWANVHLNNLDSYTEFSPSGTGVKTLCFAEMARLREVPEIASILVGDRLPRRTGYSDGEVEIYDSSSARFFTVTGHRLDGFASSVESRQEQLELVYLDLFDSHLQEKLDSRKLYLEANPGQINVEDEEIIRLARSAANCEKFRRLYQGDTSLHNDNHSEADLALCGMLAFWCGPDPTRIDRIFRTSGLVREKWLDREDYRTRTLELSIFQRDYFDWTQYQARQVEATLDDQVHALYASQEGQDTGGDPQTGDDPDAIRGQDEPDEDREALRDIQGQDEPGDDREKDEANPYEDDLRKVGIEFTALDAGPGKSWNVAVCPCCGLPGTFWASAGEAGYRCGAGRRNWVDGRYLWRNAKLRRRAVGFDEIMERDDPTWDIEDFLPTGKIIMVYGESGIAKSFLVADMMLCVGSGKPYLGRHKVLPGPVAYIYSEGDSGLKLRIKAWLAHYGVERVDPVKFIMDTFDFSLEREIDECARIVERDLGCKPKWLVIDTLSKNFGGGENDEMRKFVDSCCTLQKMLGCGIIIVHHTGKDAGKGARGGSQLGAGIDLSYSLSGIKDENGKYCAVEVSQKKLKDGGGVDRLVLDFNEIRFSDRKHDHSIVLVPSDRKPAATKEDIIYMKRIRDVETVYNRCPDTSDDHASKAAIVEGVQRFAQVQTDASGKDMSIGANKVRAIITWLTEMRHLHTDGLARHNQEKYRKATDDHVDFRLLYGPMSDLPK